MTFWDGTNQSIKSGSTDVIFVRIVNIAAKKLCKIHKATGFNGKENRWAIIIMTLITTARIATGVFTENIRGRKEQMDKKEILDILDNAKDERGAVPMRLVRQAFDKLPEQCEDTISRQAAIDAVNNAFDRETLLTGFVRSIAVRAIRDMPSAQPEIIRCKDCKYKGTKNCVANAWTTIFGFGVKDDFYCGLAERRTDG